MVTEHDSNTEANEVQPGVMYYIEDSRVGFLSEAFESLGAARRAVEERKILDVYPDAHIAMHCNARATLEEARHG